MFFLAPFFFLFSQEGTALWATRCRRWVKWCPAPVLRLVSNSSSNTTTTTTTYSNSNTNSSIKKWSIRPCLSVSVSTMARPITRRSTRPVAAEEAITTTINNNNTTYTNSSSSSICTTTISSSSNTISCNNTIRKQDLLNSTLNRPTTISNNSSHTTA